MIDNDGVGLALAVHGPPVETTGRGVGAVADLLFVHGLGSAQILWEPFVASLSDRYRCWNLDLRGHGASDRAPGHYDPAGYASDVAAALDHIGRPTIGIGHSLGGISIARVGAGRHPLLRAAYLLDSSLYRSSGQRSTSAAVFERQLDMLRKFQPANRPVDDYEAVLAGAPTPTGGTNRDAMVPSQLRGRAESLSQLDPACFEATLLGYDGSEPIAPVLTVPVRMIAADPELGAAFRPEWADRLLADSPQAEIETMAGVGHQLMMIRGFDERIRHDLEDFLDRMVG